MLQRITLKTISGWIGFDGLDWKSPGGVKYRAAYAANKIDLEVVGKIYSWLTYFNVVLTMGSETDSPFLNNFTC